PGPSPGLRPPSPRKRGEGQQPRGHHDLWPFSPLAGRRWRRADEGCEKCVLKYSAHWSSRHCMTSSHAYVDSMHDWVASTHDWVGSMHDWVASMHECMTSTQACVDSMHECMT